MVASVCVSRSTFTPSFASIAWCRPSDQRRPGIKRPVNSSTISTSPSFTTYSTSRRYMAWAFTAVSTWCFIAQLSGSEMLSIPSSRSDLNDQHFAVFHHVLNIAPIHGMGFYGGFNVVLHRPVVRIRDVVDPQQPFHFLPALVGDHRVLVLLVQHVVAGIFLG